MSGTLAPQWIFQALDDAGNAAPGAKLTSYVSGTVTKTPLYADKDLTVALSNPIEMDSHGRADFWLASNIGYTLRLETASGVLLEERNDVYGVPSRREVVFVEDLAASSGADMVGFGNITMGEAMRTLTSGSPMLGNRLSITGSSTFDFSGSARGGGYGEPSSCPWTWAQTQLGSPWQLVTNLGQSMVDSVHVAGQVGGMTSGAQDGILIQMGGNDLCKGTRTADEVLAILDGALTTCWNKLATYAVIVIPHARALPDGSAAIAAQISAYRAGVTQRAAADNRILILDHFGRLALESSTEKNPPAAMIDAGGVHLNNLGARAAASVWLDRFRNRIVPRVYGARVSADPYMQNIAGYWAAADGTIVASSSGSGAQLAASGVAGRVTQGISSALHNSTDDYVIVGDVTSLTDGMTVGVYCRSNDAAWINSMGRYAQSDETKANSVYAGDMFKFVSRPFKIPVGVLSQGTVHLGVSIENLTTSKANIHRLQLCKATP